MPPEQTFSRVIARLAKDGINTLEKSSIWQSPAWPDPNAQPAYKNAVISVDTSIKPLKLLDTLKNIELEYGRTIGARNAARPLDLDIIDYNGKIMLTDRLTLPHPRMHKRPFVLFPLSEIAPHWIDPQKNRTIHAWIAQLALNDVRPLVRLDTFT